MKAIIFALMVSVAIFGYGFLTKPVVETTEVETIVEKTIVLEEEWHGEYLQVLQDPYTQIEVEEGFKYFQIYAEEVFGRGGMRPSNFKTTLSRSLGATASTTETIFTTSLNTKDGHALVTADIGDFICMHINPGASNDEIVCCTGISGNNFTTCTRGYEFWDTVASASNAKAHSPGEVIIISDDDHYLKTQYAITDDAETITGFWTFSSDDSIASIQFGPGNSTYDKCIYVNNGDANKPELCYDESENKWIITNDGTSSIAIGGSTATFTGGDGVDITASVISVDIASTSGFSIVSDKLALKASTGFNRIFVDDDGEVFVGSGSYEFGDITLVTPLDETYGGTGTVSWEAGSIPYISADDTFGKIVSSSDLRVLTTIDGVPTWSASVSYTLFSNFKQQTAPDDTNKNTIFTIEDLPGGLLDETGVLEWRIWGNRGGATVASVSLETAGGEIIFQIETPEGSWNVHGFTTNQEDENSQKTFYEVYDDNVLVDNMFPATSTTSAMDTSTTQVLTLSYEKSGTGQVNTIQGFIIEKK